MIGIIFIGNIKYCPYLSKYTDEIESQGLEYEVLFWSREAERVSTKVNYLSFNYKSDLSRSVYFKVFDFYRYRLWLKERLSNKRYDKLIILSTLSGMIISDILLSRYSRKFIFDIRDYSYENVGLFKYIEAKLIKKSYFTGISSEGFKEFLPASDKYVLVHNFNRKEKVRKFIKKDSIKPLNVVWIGSVRYFEHQKKIIDQLKNDRRFHMIYHGTGPEIEKYTSYCNSNAIQNITFTGEYDNNHKYKLLLNADILNNSYLTDKIMEVKYAISNKYYDGLTFRIPQLVEIDTFKTGIVEKNGVGIGLNPEDKDFADKLYNYYFGIDEKTFNFSCENELDKILIEDEKYRNYINRFLSC